METKPLQHHWLKIASRPATVILLSLIYPTMFAFSKNWYAFSSRELTYLLLTLLGIGLLLIAVYHVLVPLGVRILEATGHVKSKAVRGWIPAAALATISIGSCYLLLEGTIRDALGGKLQALTTFAIAVTLGVWAFQKGMAGIYASILAVVTLTSTFELARSYVTTRKAPMQATASEPEDFEAVRFKEKPNIYFFIFDSYGSETAYSENFGFDNSAHYTALERRGFKVVQTLTNYASTWDTTTGFFLGRHHFYGLSQGNDDTVKGRDMLSGAAHNPVLETLRSNGYSVQFIHTSDYFVRERGYIDFVYPTSPWYRGVKIFASTRLNKAMFEQGAAQPTVDRQKNALFLRIKEITGKGHDPWFTFFWVPLPSHANKRVPFSEISGFTETFIEKTNRANDHMLTVMDQIIKDDPTGIVVIIGDHGAWQYNRAWLGDTEPNKAFAKANLMPRTVTLDLFGVMIAIRSAGRCDGLVYEGISPVNVMRTVMACVAQKPELMDKKAEDIALFPVRGTLWQTGKEGEPLPEWQMFKSGGAAARAQQPSAQPEP